MTRGSLHFLDENRSLEVQGLVQVDLIRKWQYQGLTLHLFAVCCPSKTESGLTARFPPSQAPPPLLSSGSPW